MYRDIPGDLLRVIEPVVQQHGLELVDAHIGQGPGRSLVRVVLDTLEGDGLVTVGDCAAVSREIGHGLDAEDFLSGSYTLEVCSPGVDRTLGREKDFVRAVGGRVQLVTKAPVSGKRRFRGKLLAFDGSQAHVQTDSGDFSIPFEQIARAQAFYPFAARESKR
jgi:ribosome maturation factor RimP